MERFSVWFPLSHPFFLSFQSTRRTQILHWTWWCIPYHRFWCYSFSFSIFLWLHRCFNRFVRAAAIKQKIAQIKKKTTKMKKKWKKRKKKRRDDKNQKWQKRRKDRQWNKTANARLNKCYWQIKSISHSSNFPSHICSCSNVHVFTLFLFSLSFSSSSSSCLIFFLLSLCSLWLFRWRWAVLQYVHAF